MCLFYSYLLIIVVVINSLVSASIFTLLKEENVTCVLTEESVYSPLYISSTNDQSSSIENFTKRPIQELTQWIFDDWDLTNSREHFFNPIEDIRWENFDEEISGKLALVQKFTTFSLCFGKSLTLMASDEFQNMEMVLLSQKLKDVSENLCQWSHYVVNEDRILQSSEGNETETLKEVWKIGFHPKLFDFGKRKIYIKIHEYDFRSSNFITLNNKISYLDISNVTDSKYLCISMFVSVDFECFLDVILESAGTNVSEKIRGFNQKDDPKSWKRIEVKTDDYSGSGKLYFYRTHSDDKRGGFWAVDKVHLCKLKKEIYHTKLKQNESQNYRCLTLKASENSGNYFEEALPTDGDSSSNFISKEFFTRPHPVKDLSIFCNTEDTLWLKWKNINPAHEVELYNITYQDQNQQILFSTFTSSCDIWENFICATLTNLKINSTYNIMVQVKKFNVSELSDSKIISGSTQFKISDAPLNIKMKLSSNPEEIILTWEHPLYTYGPLEAFKIEVNNDDDGKIGSYKIYLEKFQEKYNYKISVSYKKDYRIRIFGQNQYVGKKSEVEVSVLSPLSKFTTPLVEWCIKNCSLLIPNQNYIDFHVIVLEKNKKISEEKIKEIYRFLKENEYHNTNQWIVETRKNEENDLEAEIGDAPYKAVSVKNNFYAMYFLFEDDSSEMVGYSAQNITTKEDVNNYTTYFFITVFCIMAIFVVLAFLYKLRSSKNNQNDYNLENIELPLLRPVFSSSKSIKIEEFESFLQFSLLGNNYIKDEFQTLPNEKNKSCEVALKDKNINKNKNRNYVPYDSTRVVLQDLEDENKGDYINASYIDGYNRPKSYIACQGPKFSTVPDFWRMIWQEEVEVIVMATTFLENDGIRNCAEYWSYGLNNTCEFGAMVIKLIWEKEYQSYHQRTFEVEYCNTTRKIRHFQLKWSCDKAKPLYANDILPVVQHLNQISSSGTSPIVIHSGSGVDRNGTLILCDLALQMAKFEKEVNFYDLLQKMREQRPHMVNSVDKYVLVHLTVLEFLLEEKNPFQKFFNEYLNLDVVEQQVRYLERLFWHDAVVQSFMPQNEHKPSFLCTFVDGYQNQNQFLICKHPTKNLKLEFWKKVKNEEIRHILCLDPVENRLWPFSFKDSDLRIEITQMSNVEITSYYRMTQLLLTIYDNDKKYIVTEHQICFFQLKNWTSEASVMLVNTVDNIREVMDENEKPVLLMCQDGINSSSLFTILFYVLEKYINELEVDICKPLRILKRSNSQFTVTSGDLNFIYNSIFEYLQNVDQYKHIYNKSEP